MILIKKSATFISDCYWIKKEALIEHFFIYTPQHLNIQSYTCNYIFHFSLLSSSCDVEATPVLPETMVNTEVWMMAGFSRTPWTKQGNIIDLGPLGPFGRYVYYNIGIHFVTIFWGRFCCYYVCLDTLHTNIDHKLRNNYFFWTHALQNRCYMTLCIQWTDNTTI